MFPDMMAPSQGYYVGVVLSSELPATDRALFRDLLSQMTDLRVQVCPPLWIVSALFSLFKPPSLTPHTLASAHL